MVLLGEGEELDRGDSRGRGDIDRLSSGDKVRRWWLTPLLLPPSQLSVDSSLATAAAAAAGWYCNCD